MRSFSSYTNFALDLINCARLSSNPFLAFGFLRRGWKPCIGSFKFGAHKFQARKEDWPAVREVLVHDEYRHIERLFKPNDRPKVLDIGANIGCFALRVFDHCSEAHVCSVEAAGDTYKLLEANNQTNDTKNWKVMNFGVWGTEQPLTLMRRGTSMGHRVMANENEGAQHETEQVDGITLVALLNKLGWSSVDLIKIDIEGGEESVIPASIEALKKCRFLIIEIHTDRIDASPVIRTLNNTFKFRWKINDRRSSKPVYFLTNESDIAEQFSSTHKC